MKPRKVLGSLIYRLAIKSILENFFFILDIFIFSTLIHTERSNRTKMTKKINLAFSLILTLRNWAVKTRLNIFCLLLLSFLLTYSISSSSRYNIDYRIYHALLCHNLIKDSLKASIYEQKILLKITQKSHFL